MAAARPLRRQCHPQWHQRRRLRAQPAAAAVDAAVNSASAVQWPAVARATHEWAA